MAKPRILHIHVICHHTLELIQSVQNFWTGLFVIHISCHLSVISTAQVSASDSLPSADFILLDSCPGSLLLFWVSHRLCSGKTEIKGDVWLNTSDYKHGAFLSGNVSHSTVRPVPRRPSPITTLNDLCSDPVSLLICYDLNSRTGELLPASLCLIRIQQLP